MGGDEFVAIYISPKDDIVLKEIENVVLSCAENKDLQCRSVLQSVIHPECLMVILMLFSNLLTNLCMKTNLR